MTISIKNVLGQICVCEKGSGRMLCVVADADAEFDVPIGVLREFNEPLCDDTLATYANYRLKAALARADIRLAKGICPEIALLPVIRLFEKTAVAV